MVIEIRIVVTSCPGRVQIDWQGVKGIFCSLSWSGRWWLRCVMSECTELRTSFWVFILYKLHLNIKCKNSSLQIFCTLCVYYYLDSAPSKIPPYLNFIWFRGPCSKLGLFPTRKSFDLWWQLSFSHRQNEHGFDATESAGQPGRESMQGWCRFAKVTQSGFSLGKGLLLQKCLGILTTRDKRVPRASGIKYALPSSWSPLRIYICLPGEKIFHRLH